MLKQLAGAVSDLAIDGGGVAAGEREGGASGKVAVGFVAGAERYVGVALDGEGGLTPPVEVSIHNGRAKPRASIAVAA